MPIWIGVGGADNKQSDVPAAWTPYIGATRLQRAQNFTQILQDQGANVTLTVFPNADHTLSDDMRATGCASLGADVAAASG